MQDRLRDQMSHYLAENRVATLSTAGPPGGNSALVPYRSDGLTLECWVPCWAEALYYLEQRPPVALVIALGDQGQGLRWLHYQGRAELIPAATTDYLYRRVRVSPHRIDLVDERQGPGIRATLEGMTPPE
jgi:hypothetical protein